MLLQKICLPKNDTTIQNMYVRLNRNNVKIIGEEDMLVSENCYQAIRFNTYFNSFSRKKWQKYTTLNNLHLSLTFEGRARIVLTKMELCGNDLSEYVLSSHLVNNDTIQTCEFEYPSYSGEDCVAFHIYPLSEVFSLYVKGGYTTKVDESILPEINLSLAICTYKREDYVTKNIKMLENEVFQNRDSILHNHLKVYISDNGNSLSDYALDSDSVKLFLNKNSGGSGGFSRAVIEAMQDQSYNPTNIILMDDDIYFDVDALERNYTFLKLLKPEYEECMIGGAMFRTDHRFIQHAAGETNTLNGIIFNKSGLNMNSPLDVVKNEFEDNFNYLGWWYCCITKEVFEKKGLSLPLFVQYDDIEFSMRCYDIPKITLNGICCWHLPFDKKWSSFKNYYTIRNRTIVNCIRFDGMSKKRFIKELKHLVFRGMFQYSFNEVNLILLAAEHFMKGMPWLIQQDPSELNKKVIQMSDKLIETDKLPIPFNYNALRTAQNFNPKESRPLLRLITLNGWLLPANRTMIVTLEDPPTTYFYRAKEVIKYDINSGKGFVVYRDKNAAKEIINRWIKLKKEINAHFDERVEEYRRMVPEVTSKEFWLDFLK